MTRGGAADEDPELELLQLLSDEFAAGGISGGVAPGQDGVPAQLIVDIAAGHKVHVCFLPGHDQPPVLQYLVAFDVDLEPAAAEAAARFVQLLNTTLPLTGFELSESARSVVFRYVQPVYVHPLDPAVIAWPLSMIYFAVSYFGDLVAAVCAGMPFDEVVARFEAVQAEVSP